MKKSNSKKEKEIEEGLQFIESFQKMLADQDEKTIAISLRIPKNILTALKFKAQAKKKKYQSLLVDYVRQGLKSDEV